MRKSMIAGIVLILAMIFSMVPAYAGSINGPEAGLISQASGTFRYQGKNYKATSSALGQLRAYLSRDDIELTPEQAERAASLMYSNVEGGVLDGYLTPVEGVPGTTGSSDSNSVLNRPQKSNAQKNKKEKAGKASVQVRESRSSLRVAGVNGQAVFKSDLPVKDTGFSFGKIIALFVILMFLLPAGTLAAWKLRLFAHRHVS